MSKTTIVIKSTFSNFETSIRVDMDEKGRATTSPSQTTKIGEVIRPVMFVKSTGEYVDYVNDVSRDNSNKMDYSLTLTGDFCEM